MLEFFGLKGVIETWGAESDLYALDEGCHRRITRPCLVLIGLINACDTVVDLIISFNATWRYKTSPFDADEAQCQTTSSLTTAIILFVMTLAASYLRSVVAKLQIGEDYIENRRLKYLMTESIVFTMEDAASVMFLATRSCPFSQWEQISSILTLFSFVPIGFGMLYLLIMVISEFDVRKKKKQGTAGILFTGTFTTYFGYVIFYLLLTKIFKYRGDGPLLDGRLYIVTLSLYWCAVVLLPFSALTYCRDHIKLKEIQVQDQTDDELEEDPFDDGDFDHSSV